MRLEIIIEDDQPLFYPFQKKLLIGSDPSCDIVIEHPEVSRKHVQVYPEDDQFYLVDQGSRNGTFLNDERLIPGKKTEFTSFFPVRLGKSILISLISDEETMESTRIDFPAPKPEAPKPAQTRNHEATTVISLKDLQKQKTANLVKKRATVQKKAAAKEAPKKKKKKTFQTYHFVALAIIGVAYYFQTQLRDDPPPVANGEAPVETSGQTGLKKVSKPAVELPTILPTAGDILRTQFTQKGCRSEEEKKFCDQVPNLRSFVFTDKGGDAIVEYDPYFDQAVEILRKYDEKLVQARKYEKEDPELAKIVAGLAFVNGLVRFPALEGTDAVLTVGFVYKLGEIETLAAVAAFKVATLPSLAVLLNQQRIEAIKMSGPGVLDFPDFYKVWGRDDVLWNGPKTTESRPVDVAEPVSSTIETAPAPSTTPTPTTPTTTNPAPTTVTPPGGMNPAMPEKPGTVNPAMPTPTNPALPKQL